MLMAGCLAGYRSLITPISHKLAQIGAFSISDVPAGDYTLVVWQEQIGTKEMPVTVTAGGTTELDVDLDKT